MNQETSYKIAFGISVLIIIGLLLYAYALPKYDQKIFIRGFNQGQLVLIQDICDDGLITRNINDTLQNIPFNPICLNRICGEK